MPTTSRKDSENCNGLLDCHFRNSQGNQKMTMMISGERLEKALNVLNLLSFDFLDNAATRVPTPLHQKIYNSWFGTAAEIKSLDIHLKPINSLSRSILFSPVASSGVPSTAMITKSDIL